MKNSTDLEKVKEASKLFFDMIELKPLEELPFICQHPFTNTTSVYIPKSVEGVNEWLEANPDYKTVFGSTNGVMLDVTQDKERELFRQATFKLIDKSTSLSDIFIMINSAWYMTFLKLIKPFLSAKDFGKYLAQLWIQQEYPNKDCNLSTKTAISWFKSAYKKSMMDKEELTKYNELSDKCLSEGLTVYRGVSYDGKPSGLSWTTDRTKAIWFAKRFSSDNGKLYSMTLHSPDSILAYFSSRGESEVIINTGKEHNWTMEEV